jgi:hypothetical protein
MKPEQQGLRASLNSIKLIPNGWEILAYGITPLRGTVKANAN